MSDRAPEFWEQCAKVAMGLQGDDPVNWPHYADEARRLVEEVERLRGAVEAVETLHRALKDALSGDKRRIERATDVALMFEVAANSPLAEQR